MKSQIEIEKYIAYLRNSLIVHKKTNFFNLAHEEQIRIQTLNWVIEKLHELEPGVDILK